jgi:hypothetical protein
MIISKIELIGGNTNYMKRSSVNLIRTNHTGGVMQLRREGMMVL